MKRYILSILLLLGCVYVAGSSADIFQWTDAQGNVHFGDRPPAAASPKRITVEINSYQSVTIEPFEAFQSESDRPQKIVMYSTAWCGVCKRARRFFRVQGIPFQEYDVEKSEKGRRDYKRLNGRGVPILLVGDKRMNGFSVGRFRNLYEK